ncbi:hypothetical protein CK203_110049 [Vitis vinifera]|uniref:Reverse transcriptase domain-containing protein n=1 Tax=Vitis vinifera TaxID=29760 RepID=A0A438EA01_VITVI|nr:hypothetical protein CK203_110049 [Vitis vinifera]
MGGGLRRGPTPFRFENMWLKVDGFKGLLREWWQGIEVRGRASFSQGRLHKWVLLEEVHWRQKSRELWLKEGDRNGYFHRMANAHRRNNSLDRIMINGEWLTEDQEVREGIVNAFQNFLSEEPGWRADIEGLHLNQLNPREAEDLEKPFTEEEIHGALMEMRGDKAPGPDGFTMAFWQECWCVCEGGGGGSFKEFFEYGSFSKCLNTTFLVLIPKKGGAEDLGDFRPISLLGGLYKSWPKCFGRWDLGRVGWIGCGGVSTAKFSILINGVPAGFFPNSKGLRQGDPLSPYLFILGMEVLSTLLDGLVRGVSFLARASSNLSWILAWFEAASGLRINLAKSALIPVGQVDELEEMAAELGCRLESIAHCLFGAAPRSPS